MNAAIPCPTAEGESANCALVVSHDRAVAGQLKTWLEDELCYPAALADNYVVAEEWLSGKRPCSVFLDLREGAAPQSPKALLTRLAARDTPPIPVIAIADESYVCDWAGLADQIIYDRLHMPLDRRQVAQLLERRNLPVSFGPCTATAIPRVVRSETLQIKTHTPAMAAVLDDLIRIAPRDVTLLMVGETGTGKTTLARLVHELSSRAQHKLTTVAAGVLPPDLIESELFGHVKGAFTGAERDKLGKFDVAAEGTLLLDEIDILRPREQAKLLRVIESGEFEPVGSNETRKSATRLIAASNVDLKSLMDQGQFRADLYYRLNVLEFRIAPLRERPHDIVPLALDFIEEFCNSYKISIRRIHPEFLRKLKAYPWPGNIRELKNHVRRAVLFCQDGALTPDALPTDTPPTDAALAYQPASDTALDSLSERVAQSEIEILRQALRANNNKRTTTAKSLGISRVGLYKKMKKYGLLDQPEFSAVRS